MATRHNKYEEFAQFTRFPAPSWTKGGIRVVAERIILIDRGPLMSNVEIGHGTLITDGYNFSLHVRGSVVESCS